MSIYTRTGDDGTTSLFGGRRVKKSDSQIAAYGAVDELTSFLGLVEAKIDNKKDKEFITAIQNDLYQIMAKLSGYPKLNPKGLEKRVLLFEKTIDAIDSKLPKLTSFILPQGGEVTALFHISRTICRRAEREVVKYCPLKKLHVTRLAGGRACYMLHVLKYLNRLSDLLFTFARKYSKQEKLLTV